MTNTESNNDPAYIRQLFDSMNRLVGSMVNDLQEVREAMAERDRQMTDLSDRLGSNARSVRDEAELQEQMAGRVTLVENLVLAELDDREEREAFARLVQPGRAETQRRVRNLLGIAKSIEGANGR